MRKKKITEEKVAVHHPDDYERDPFLRRIQLQGTVLKKILAEVDLQTKYEDNNKEPKKLNNSKTFKIHKQSNT